MAIFLFYNIDMRNVVTAHNSYIVFGYTFATYNYGHCGWASNGCGTANPANTIG